MQQQNKQMKKETVKIAKYLDLMMPMYNLIVCDNNHSKAFKLKKTRRPPANGILK